MSLGWRAGTGYKSPQEAQLRDVHFVTYLAVEIKLDVPPVAEQSPEFELGVW